MSSNPTKVMGFFSALFAMLCSLIQLSIVRWGLSLRLDLIICENGFILCQNGFKVIIHVNDDFLEKGECYDQKLLPYALLMGLYPISGNCFME